MSQAASKPDLPCASACASVSDYDGAIHQHAQRNDHAPREIRSRVMCCLHEDEGTIMVTGVLRLKSDGAQAHEQQQHADHNGHRLGRFIRNPVSEVFTDCA